MKVEQRNGNGRQPFTETTTEKAEKPLTGMSDHRIALVEAFMKEEGIQDYRLGLRMLIEAELAGER